MEQSEAKFTVNSPRMIFETIDQETVVIDTESGTYFNQLGGFLATFVQLSSFGGIKGRIGDLKVPKPDFAVQDTERHYVIHKGLALWVSARRPIDLSKHLSDQH